VPFFRGESSSGEVVEQEGMPGLAALRRKIDDDMRDEAMHLTALAETGRALSNDCISQDALGKLARYVAMKVGALRGID
jgi:hypothetical protein